MKEEWKEVAGYPNFEISNMGRLKNKVTGRISTGNLNDSGYMRCILYDKDGSRKYTKIHRLVAQAFIPNPDNLPEVNHIDGDKTNNKVTNLEWVSHKRNMEHLYETKEVKHIKAQPVLCVETNKIFPSVRKAAEAVGVNKQRVCDAIHIPNRTAAGYHWKYAE